MLNSLRLKDALGQYKKDFVGKWWSKEKFKWEAVKCFQDHWDINAANFAEMLDLSLEKTGVLLISHVNFPRAMIVGFAKSAPEEVRAAFKDLFDESQDLYERIDAFKKKSNYFLKTYGGEAKQHYQNENAISTYLWLRYPDKYYIYKYGITISNVKKLEADYHFKQGAFADNIRNFMRFYDELNIAIQADSELVSLFQSQLTDSCYSDPGLKTLTFDFGFYLTKWEPSSPPPSPETTDPSKIGGGEGGESPISYTKADFLNEVYMRESRYDRLVAVLRKKKNIILQGAPGVGKTFTARRLAWSMMGKKENHRIEFVQFHQNYSYEDFMMGYKPVDDGFELRYGALYRFCQRAESQPDQDFFFIIDEINRGNISKIFGELLMLIEKDYRGTEVSLAYNGQAFRAPKNLYLIGMLNTADRSLAMIDYALRRRFSFFEVEPGFDSEGFIRYQDSFKSERFNRLVSKVKELNREITLDKSLGKGFCIGHSYFCSLESCSDEELRSIVDYDLLPMLSEYWFDDLNKCQRWENALQGLFDDER